MDIESIKEYVHRLTSAGKTGGEVARLEFLLAEIAKLTTIETPKSDESLSAKGFDYGEDNAGD